MIRAYPKKIESLKLLKSFDTLELSYYLIYSKGFKWPKTGTITNAKNRVIVYLLVKGLNH
jgi:hypothetical protein